MTKADNSETQRISGWTPPRAPGGTEHATTGAGPGPHRLDGPPPVRSGRPLLVLAAATGLAVIGYGIAAVVVIGTDSARTPERALPAPEWVPGQATPPVSVLPSPPAESAVPTREIRTVRVESTARPGRGPASPTSAAGTSPAADPAFTVGRTVGVGVTGLTGHRLRNRDFVARIEADSAAGGPSGRFVVRQGLADARCVSFESAEFPGFHLRHRNYVLLVERAEPSALYRADATFCPEASAGGYALRSVNFPNHRLVRADGLVRLVEVPAGQATVFRALAPI
ncbi:AbfB domain-containing protein [Actinoplanes sp. CA-252034]|uniref:AbfB domain-containing protein n=1 Tax=Actinoplanes sp. CA-252034 TaxID=3239906 RepID=UPI003D96D61A